MASRRTNEFNVLRGNLSATVRTEICTETFIAEGNLSGGSAHDRIPPLCQIAGAPGEYTWLLRV
jgi:hypothetical protein